MVQQTSKPCESGSPLRIRRIRRDRGVGATLKEPSGESSVPMESPRGSVVALCIALTPAERPRRLPVRLIAHFDARDVFGRHDGDKGARVFLLNDSFQPRHVLAVDNGVHPRMELRLLQALLSHACNSRKIQCEGLWKALGGSTDDNPRPLRADIAARVPECVLPRYRLCGVPGLTARSG